MTEETLIHGAITVGGWVALVATMKARLREHEDRIEHLEKCEEKMPEEYVPRREMEAILKGVDQKMDTLIGYARLFVRRSPRGNERNHQ